jgi:hypothetical protein
MHHQEDRHAQERGFRHRRLYYSGRRGSGGRSRHPCGCRRTIGHPGEPALPIYSARILLPPGEEIASFRITETSPVERSSHLPAPAEREYPLSMAGPFPATEPKAAIYGSDALFPAEAAELVTVQIYRGYRIAYINLFPLQVRAASRTAEFTREMTLVVTTAPSSQALQQTEHTYRGAESTRHSTLRWLERNVDNAEMAEAYRQAWESGTIVTAAAHSAHSGTGASDVPDASELPPGSAIDHSTTLVDPADTYLYVIITNASMTPAYQPLADDWTERGLPATIVDVADILATYTGRDNQEQIRNFIVDAYQNWESEYVLFGADANVIPDRDCYCYVIDEGTPIETNDLCCELYYQGLDGTWNDDDDDRWGEEGEEDLIPDIHIGRSCTDNVAQVEAFVTKVLRYEREPVVSEVASAALFGEYLWEDTWGEMYMEEIRLGSDAWGYETAGIPQDWDVATHYEMSGNWSGNTFINEMNAGTHMAHHLGHSDFQYNIKVYSSDVPSFTNDGITHTYSFGYSQGCNAGGFDIADCIHEEWVKYPTGFAAWVGNTRYGFGVYYTTNGSSQYYHRQFVDALWNEDINELAAANNDSRVDNVGYIDYESNRWVHYEITAFGDPAMPLWSATPRTPSLEHAGVFVLGMTSYDVTVRAAGDPIADARVCMWNELGTAYAFGVTDQLGQVTLDLDPGYPGTMHIVVCDANLLVTDETIPIIPNGPYIVVESHAISDDAGGNGDGGCDAGETIDLGVELTNVWDEPITGVYATLVCESAHVEITDDTAQYGDFAGGETKGGLAGDHFVFHILGTCPDQATLDFTLTIHDDNEGEWDGNFSYGVEAPLMAVAWMSVDDSAGGDGDGVLEPGESAEISIIVGNDGHEDALSVTATFITGSGFLTVTQPSASGGDIPAGGQSTLTPDFGVTLDAGAPSPWLIHCTLQIAGDWELAASLPVDLPVGGLRDNMENGEGDWTHEIVSSGFVDEWHLSNQRNHTPQGAHSWKFGAVGTGDYSNLGDGALISETIDIAETTVLTFLPGILLRRRDRGDVAERQ